MKLQLINEKFTLLLPTSITPPCLKGEKKSWSKGVYINNDGQLEINYDYERDWILLRLNIRRSYECFLGVVIIR